jgi:DNA processing protein
MEDEIVLRCAMAREFLYRPHVANGLVQEYGSAQDVLESKAFEKVFSPDSIKWAQQEVEWCCSKGVKLIFNGEKDYPALLAQVPDAPFMLYYKGEADLNNPRSISMVGTRLASVYGKEACSMVVEHLAEYLPLVVSGLAYGIDIASHRAALENGLPTVAVLPNGLDMVYPARHRDVAVQMVRCGGGLLTEFPRGTSPQKMNFVKRNRIIAAMTQALVVVESRVKGGSMITAEYANMYNKDVFAVPGRISDPNSFGCNYLISKNVAAIYSSALTLPTALGWSGDAGLEPGLQPQLFSFDVENKEKILLTLKFDTTVDVEKICAVTELDWGVVSSLLLELELEGKVVSKGSSEYCLRR